MHVVLVSQAKRMDKPLTHFLELGAAPPRAAEVAELGKLPRDEQCAPGTMRAIRVHDSFFVVLFCFVWGADSSWRGWRAALKVLSLRRQRDPGLRLWR